MTIPARLHIVTLAVADLPTAVEFYTALGWSKASSSFEEIAWFDVGGCWLGLFPRDELAADAGVEASSGFAVTFAINFESPQAVDDAMAAAQTAGAVVTQPAARVEWGGYRGYFADPDGHLWEIAHNPNFPIEPDGSIVIP
jgi:catechol 2,3-dioxygenase-like lactoylglutathione lyase family enzyme